VQTLQLGSASVQFESVLTTAEWQAVLRAGGITAADSGLGLKNAMKALAARAVTDAGLRSQVPALGAWFKGLSDRNVPVASVGIVVGGGVADSVVVRDNDLLGVAEAVHVAVRSGGLKTAGARRSAGRIELSGNRAALRVPFELLQGPRAYYVGNANHAVVADNEMRLDSSAKVTRDDAVLEGIRVWGFLGALVRVDDNLLAGCGTGVRIQPQVGALTPHLWEASGNVAPDAGSAVVAPPSVTRSGNVP
jgi:hypothetical protein